MKRIKKFCGDCKALRLGSAFSECELGYRISHVRVLHLDGSETGFSFPKPEEVCPKPTTYAKLIELTKDGKIG